MVLFEFPFANKDAKVFFSGHKTMVGEEGDFRENEEWASPMETLPRCDV